MGLPGSGKTTLAEFLAKELHAVHWNADAVRNNINTHLGFSIADRIEQARRMGWLCDQVVKSGHIAVADFVCPLEETRAAFSADFTVWMNTIPTGRFADTNAMFLSPDKNEVDYIVKIFDAENIAKDIANIIKEKLTNV